jgi:hypothetical protein
MTGVLFGPQEFKHFAEPILFPEPIPPQAAQQTFPVARQGSMRSNVPALFAFRDENVIPRISEVCGLQNAAALAGVHLLLKFKRPQKLSDHRQYTIKGFTTKCDMLAGQNCCV